MKPSPFLYRAPRTLSQALDNIAECAEDGGKVLAGGQSLIPMLNYRLVRPPVLVDIAAVTKLAERRLSEDRIVLGATTRTGWLARDPQVRATWPLLATAASWVGHAQIRSRGTVGGSIAHADPAAELGAVIVLADAELRLESIRGSRTVSADDFFLGYLATSLEEDELLTRLSFSIPHPRGRWGFEEFAPRHGDFAEAGAACTLPALGAPGQGRVVAFGIADRPLRLPHLEGLLDGSTEQISRDQVTDAVIADCEAHGRALPEKHQIAAEYAVRALTSAGLAVA